MFVFCFFVENGFCLRKVLWGVLPTVPYICLPVSCGFWGKWLLFQKRFVGGFCQLFFALVSKSSSVFWRQSCLNCRQVSPTHLHSIENDPLCRGILCEYFCVQKKSRSLLSCKALAHAPWNPFAASVCHTTSLRRLELTRRGKRSVGLVV